MTESSPETPALEVEIKGLDKLEKAMKKFPRTVIKNWSAAGKEVAEDIILPVEGLRNYPPATDANIPPFPFYLRSVGTQYSVGGNTMTSENLGKKWTVTRRGLETTISNPASYARYVHGEEQAKAMAEIGWKKLLKVATEKAKQITVVYQAWVNKTLRDVGLK